MISGHALSLARALARMNTVSHRANLELIDFVPSELARLGVKCRPTHDASKTKANLFATLVHVLGRTGRTADGGIHDGSSPHFQPVGLQHPAHFGKRCLAQSAPLQQAAEPQQRRGVRHTFAAQIDAHQAPQGRAVE